MKRVNLQKKRKKCQLTQNQIAESLGVSTVFYAMIERGERNPSLDLAKKIAELFNTSIDELFF